MATNNQVIAFFKLIGPLAVAECNRRIAIGEPFILPSVCIAQASLETGYGTAGIMTRANAFFGIKAGGSWTGKVYTANTKEVKDGVEYNTVANFRAYDSLAESLADYYSLMTGASRYSKALSWGSDRSQWLTARQTLTALWQGGYATDELYVQKNMNIIEPRKLTDWDMLVDGKGDIATLEKTFNPADFVQGALIVTDSGRSIGLNASDTTKISIPWDKRIKISSNYEYVFNMTFANKSEPYPYLLHFAHVKDDVARIFEFEDLIIPGPRDQENQKEYGDWSYIIDLEPGEYSIMLSREDGQPLAPADLEGMTFSVGLNSGYPGSTEVTKSVLAYFVKVDGKSIQRNNGTILQ